MGFLNPWVIVGWLASLGGAAWFGYGAGQDAEVADQSRVVAAVTAAGNEAASAAAGQIAKISVKNTTIRQTLEKEVHERPVYRDCISDPTARRLLNDTIGAATAASAPGGGELPASGPSR